MVARGLVPFALGTDTAGSGRVPAGFNNLVGVKATCGAISTRGVVPACRSLDCVSIFALTVNDAGLVSDTMAGFDADDAFSRKPPYALPLDGPALRRPGPIQRLAIPDHPQWFGDQQAEAAWNTAVSQWRQQNVELVPLDFSPMLELAALLYEGPWVAERHAAVESFMASHGDDMNPVVKGIISKAGNFSATDTFKAQYRKEELQRQIDELLADVDALLSARILAVHRSLYELFLESRPRRVLVTVDQPDHVSPVGRKLTAYHETDFLPGLYAKGVAVTDDFHEENSRATAPNSGGLE